MLHGDAEGDRSPRASDEDDGDDDGEDIGPPDATRVILHFDVSLSPPRSSFERR